MVLLISLFWIWRYTKIVGNSSEVDSMNERIYYSREAELRANREKIVTIILFLALGVGVGAALALLFAPKSGQQTRSDLAQAFEDGFDSGRGATQSAVQRLEKGVSELASRVEHLSERK
jgi:hypothetical protein